jgi:hypothetical protein
MKTLEEIAALEGAFAEAWRKGDLGTAERMGIDPGNGWAVRNNVAGIAGGLGGALAIGPWGALAGWWS